MSRPLQPQGSAEPVKHTPVAAAGASAAAFAAPSSSVGRAAGPVSAAGKTVAGSGARSSISLASEYAPFNGVSSTTPAVVQKRSTLTSDDGRFEQSLVAQEAKKRAWRSRSSSWPSKASMRRASRASRAARTTSRPASWTVCCSRSAKQQRTRTLEMWLQSRVATEIRLFFASYHEFYWDTQPTRRCQCAS